MYIDNDKNFEEEVVNQAYDYLVENSSLRKVSKKYNISHVSLRARFMNNLPEIDLELSKVINGLREERREKTINDDATRRRVSKAVALMISKDLTIKEIAENLGSTEGIIYRDILVRLPKLKEFGDDTIELIKGKLTLHSLENLKNVGPHQRNA